MVAMTADYTPTRMNKKLRTVLLNSRHENKQTYISGYNPALLMIGVPPVLCPRPHLSSKNEKNLITK